MLTRLYLFIILLNLSQTIVAQQHLARWERHAHDTEIIRDQWGIPHIYGKTDADAVFGLLYAQCEDDFNRVEVNYITAMGRMAEVEGVSELYADLRMRLYIDPETVKEEYENSPPWLKSLMDAWADGINYYLHTHPEVEPKLITNFEPWMALTFSEGSIGGDIETISVNRLKDFYDRDFHAYLTYTERNFDEEPKGSNGFAIAPELTVNGHALLMINPHTSFYFRPEVHVVSDEGLNAYGAVTWGQFFVYQGFNEYNGWMHTSSKADAIDHYALTVEERDGRYYYKFGKEWRPLTEKSIRLKYKEDGKFKERAITAYYSHHGPVIRADDDRWIAIALMVEREKALTQSFQRTKTTNHDAYKQVMELKTNSSNNTVYADRDGNIVYYHGNFIPIRNQGFDWRNVVDGSNPATDWKGLHAIEEMIYIQNPANGWIQNANSTPFTAAGDHSPKPSDYPDYIAWDLENARGLNAVRLLKDQKNFTLQSLIDLSYDPKLLAFEPLIPVLVNAYNHLDQNDRRKNELRAPIDTLQQWDLNTGSQSVATALAIHFGSQIVRKAAVIERPWDAYLFDFIAENAPDTMFIEALENAIAVMETDFGTWNTPWGDINRFQRLTHDIQGRFDDDQPSIAIPFNSSFYGSLAAYGSRQYSNTKKWYGSVGNSFVAAVEFGDKVVAKSLLAGGQSGDPSSQHFTDQAEMYSRGEFKDVHFYREDVLKNKKISYRPGQTY
ncbi:penicillin acylase family protein [Anditalea andensis]|uniref:Penicillin amidase n=1 Tax=Anditalea andensis TaxID=1048983 RepID=A0A074L7A4_9BACT|nr:penicillin acylase family protein [Anditalea andensis]KEO75718.1 penicillin amidase [Anditalea andensis]